MTSSPTFLRKSSLQNLIDILKHKGYQVLGPRLHEGAVMWEEVQDEATLPRGWQDIQEPGRYRLDQVDSKQFFDVVHGPESLKKFVFAPREPLLTIEKKNRSLSIKTMLPQHEKKVAILGVRSCDLAGLMVQDRIFLKDSFPDPHYKIRRDGLFLIAVNCTRAVSTCFCVSMHTGPQAQEGFDIALTELKDGFVVTSGSQVGAEVLGELNLPHASERDVSEADARIQACAQSQMRHIDTESLPESLYRAHDHPRWDEVASRCLSCTNCTMVCPTCFCHTVEETPDLEGQRSEHQRLWDSCFTDNHGYIHGKNIRPTIKDRYRQWLIHKFASWIDQFGSSGCVGCGRCISWCPVGIDPTQEINMLLQPPDHPEGNP